MRSWIRFQRLFRWAITNVSAFCGRSASVAALFPSLFAKICNGRMYLGLKSMRRIFPACLLRSVRADNIRFPTNSLMFSAMSRRFRKKS